MLMELTEERVLGRLVDQAKKQLSFSGGDTSICNGMNRITSLLHLKAPFMYQTLRTRPRSPRSAFGEYVFIRTDMARFTDYER